MTQPLRRASFDQTSDDNEDNLPYPEALLRSDFSRQDFDASKYLSTLSDRRQTLEDLQADLRERSQFLSKELLDLVNINYEKFLSLGSNLRGGEERLEDVRMSLLGFKRGVSDVRGKVCSRKEEVEGLLKEKTHVMREIMMGRDLLEVDARLEDLEDSLILSSLDPTVSMLGDAEDQIDAESETKDQLSLSKLNLTGTTSKNLHYCATDFRSLEALIEKIGIDHPFIVTQQSRIKHLKDEIIFNLSTALKQIASLIVDDKTSLITILRAFDDLGEASKAVSIIKTNKQNLDTSASNASHRRTKNKAPTSS
ncbi:BgTH12-07493 [Blumeria graminis f. sp. triticale]|uniref:Conserved oligomeric Golgi complex subunit 2 n=3 Tax=Blumeria graminis TaxID=34373 RepID=A0A9X9LAN7_BLUGR|nr:hypothetical protein BGT96224_A20755 [Blumeria graminis f. sp. tritici 96224]CAD6500315.1 BgTH12-07493 [Blumeria graminis f. sp. triticale]VCU40567.1 BgtA-20755 [Blumeria graminis f. sp. tritici]